jgi:hypothetical protein
MSKNKGKSKLSKNVLFNANKHVFYCEKSLGTLFYGQPSYIALLYFTLLCNLDERLRFIKLFQRTKQKRAEMLYPYLIQFPDILLFSSYVRVSNIQAQFSLRQSSTATPRNVLWSPPIELVVIATN